jgi:predicted glycosyltransferase
MKAFIHVQHLLGSGHVVRAVAIGRALAEAGVAVTLATGNRIPATLDTGGLAIVELPAARAADATFAVLLDDRGAPIDEAWRERRRAATLAAFEGAAPDILFTETFPFGRRQFAFELFPLLETAHRASPPPLVAASVRDILVRKEDLAKERWIADTARALYDVVLVHADPGFVRLADSFPFADRIADLTRYTGYVHTPSPIEPPPGDGEAEVIVSCGGGPVGRQLFETAIAARRLSRRLADRRWLLLVSERHVAERGHLSASIGGGGDGNGGGILIEPARADFPGLLRRAALSISQAGYNTVLDVLSAGVPAVLVPFAEAAETEQTQRAAILAERGLAITLEEQALTAEALAAAADRAVAGARPRHEVRMDGAKASADILIASLRRV